MERSRTDYVTTGIQIFNWMWEWGWDVEYGGIFYYRDAYNRPSSEYWHDMKFWWPQCEAVLAALYAWRATGDRTNYILAQTAFEWAEEHMADRRHGEWFGYLHRDGTRSSALKGNMFKEPFHIPRMLLIAGNMVDEVSG